MQESVLVAPFASVTMRSNAKAPSAIGARKVGEGAEGSYSSAVTSLVCFQL